MLGLDTQYWLRDVFRTIAERELEIERQRQILGEIQDFEPYAAFCRVNRHEDKRITADEIFAFLQQNGVNHLTEVDCGHIVSYFDSDSDNGLNYKEWMEALLPCDDLYMRSVITQRPSFDCPRHMNLSFTIEKQLAHLLKSEIEYHLNLQNLKHQLKRRVDYSNMRAFQTIDNRGEGFLNYNNIMNFCRMNSWRASESEIIAIVRRLDIDADQRITFNEWDETMADLQVLAPAQHGNPDSEVRQDHYFRHTSPVKNYESRSSPQRDALSPARNYTQSHLQYASNVARKTREEYETRQRESPLRGSPQRYEAARQPTREQPIPTAAVDRSSPLRASPRRSTTQTQQPQPYGIDETRNASPRFQAVAVQRSSSPRRPDSPLRQKSPRVETRDSVSYSASLARRTDSPIQRAAAADYGQPRTSITQSLMMNSNAKQHRMNDNAGETNYEHLARTSRTIANQRQEEGDGAQYTKGVTGSAPKRHNLPFDEEEKLIDAFREYVRLELELDEAKSRLASQPDFNLMDAYQMVDKFSKGWVTAPEIIEALADLGAYPHKDDVYLFVRRYDRDGDGRILYSDFCDALTPWDESVATAMSRRPAYHIQHGYCRTHFFMVETRNMFLSTLRTHFTVEEQAEMLRKRLSRRPNFNVHEAFQAIDRDSNGYLTRTELRRILGDNGVYVSERDLCMLVGRFDRNNDGRISYAEFMEEMVSKCPNK